MRSLFCLNNNVLMIAMVFGLSFTACSSEEPGPDDTTTPPEQTLPKVNLACEPSEAVATSCETTTPDTERYERCVYDSFVLERIQEACSNTSCEERAFDAFDVVLSCERIVSGELGRDVTFRGLFPPKKEDAVILLDCIWGSVGKK